MWYLPQRKPEPNSSPREISTLTHFYRLRSIAHVCTFRGKQTLGTQQYKSKFTAGKRNVCSLSGAVRCRECQNLFIEQDINHWCHTSLNVIIFGSLKITYSRWIITGYFYFDRNYNLILYAKITILKNASEKSFLLILMYLITLEVSYGSSYISRLEKNYFY